MSHSFAGRGGALVAACLLVAVGSSAAKPIRLRDQTISPETLGPSGAAQALAAPATVSGLYLIQFRTSPDATVRTQLAGIGVDLLHYVPEDSFIARCYSVQLQQLSALPFVEWVGEYRPEHKVHEA